MANYILMGCPRCGKGKSGLVHSFAAYRVYEDDTNIKMVCKTCKYVFRFRYIRGGQNND